MAMARSLGEAERDGVLRRARRVLLSRGRAGPPRGWSVAVPVIALAAGFLFTTSATTADGTPLREDRRLELTELILERQERVAEAEAVLGPLEDEVESLTAELAGSDTPVRGERERADQYRTAAGFSALSGPGLTVVLDDALRPDGVRPDGARADDLLVHQEDMQAVVNALWAGGAEAMSIMGIRVVSTSAVICVGPVLLLHGRPYSPPYVVRAIGDPDALLEALAESPGVQLFREAADAYGLGYRETVEEDVTVPAYDGTSTLRVGRVPQ
jgi:uncharacterized protein YlxW (UPF0749 family)